MPRLNSIIRITVGVAVVTTLLVCQLVEPQAKLSRAKIVAPSPVPSVAYYTQADRRAHDDRDKEAKNRARLLRRHHPEKLLEARHLVFPPAEAYFHLDLSLCGRFELLDSDRPSFLVHYCLPTNRAPPLGRSSDEFNLA